MARKTHRKKPGMTISLAMVAGLAPLAIDTITTVQKYGVAEVPHVLAYHLAGVNTWDNNKFDFKVLMQGWSPIILGMLAHKVAGKLGINRALGNAGIPLIRI